PRLLPVVGWAHSNDPTRGVSPREGAEGSFLLRFASCRLDCKEPPRQLAPNAITIGKIYRKFWAADGQTLRNPIMEELSTTLPEGLVPLFLTPDAFGEPKSQTICYKRPMRLQQYTPRPAHLKWLLDSDPAIRWQVMRDLTYQAPNTIADERSRVASEGWGGELLARQSRTGNWGGPSEDRGLLTTLYSLVVLMD